MRRLLFWHRHSTSHTKSPAGASEPTRRFRRLAFQTLESRDLKAADTTTIVAAPIVTTTDLTNFGSAADFFRRCDRRHSKRGNSSPGSIPPTDPSAPVVTKAGQIDSGGQTLASNGSAVPTALATDVSQAPADNCTGGPSGSITTFTTSPAKSGPQSDGTVCPVDLKATPAEIATQVSGPASGNSAGTNNTAATGSPNIGAAVQAVPQSPRARTPPGKTDPSIAQGATAANPIGRSEATPTAASSQDGYGGAATGYGAANGYGGAADGYGGSTGYGGDPGYGGSAPHLDTVSVDQGTTSTNISGTVTGESNLAGSTVVFGGQLNGYTTTVNGDNGFQIGIPAVPPIHGTVTVTVIDSHGTPSNTVIIYLS